MKLRLVLAGLLVALAAAGCSTFEKRARELPAVVAMLDAATQARLKEGKVALGDTADMVYLALGAPDEKHDQVSTDGGAIVWIYQHHWQEYRGERVMGYQAINAPASGGGTPTTVYQPIQQSIYEDKQEERLRVTLKDGKVTVIERPQG
jgi:hypothetical protein